MEAKTACIFILQIEQQLIECLHQNGGNILFFLFLSSCACFTRPPLRMKAFNKFKCDRFDTGYIESDFNGNSFTVSLGSYSNSGRPPPCDVQCTSSQVSRAFSVCFSSHSSLFHGPVARVVAHINEHSSSQPRDIESSFFSPFFLF